MDFIITDLKIGISEGHITGNFQDDDNKEYKFLCDDAGNVIAVSDRLENGYFNLLPEDEAKKVIDSLNDVKIIVSEECPGSDAEKEKAADSIKQFAEDMKQFAKDMKKVHTFMSGITILKDQSPSHDGVRDSDPNYFHPDDDLDMGGFVPCKEAGIKIVSNIIIQDDGSLHVLSQHLNNQAESSRH